MGALSVWTYHSLTEDLIAGLEARRSEGIARRDRDMLQTDDLLPFFYR